MSGKTFVLTTDENAYEISRWWPGRGKALTIPRDKLPTGCKTARFFLNDSTHELRMAEPTICPWVTGAEPSLPDNNYPPCALLVTYGSFSGPPAQEELTVTSTEGALAKDQRKTPHLADYALFPVAAAAEMVVGFYLAVGTIITLPIWLPILLVSERNGRQRKEDEKKELPIPVAVCWSAIDEEMKNGGPSNPDKNFSAFEWNSKTDNAYTVTTANELFSKNNPLPVDSRVILHQGRVNILNSWTGTDVECGLRSEKVVATRLNFLP